MNDTPSAPASFDDWLEAAWLAHAVAASDDDYARRLVEVGTRIDTHDQAGPYVRLLAHVLGEHRGEWHRGLRALEALAARLGPSAGPGPRAIVIAREALAAASGVEDVLPALGAVPDLADPPEGPADVIAPPSTSEAEDRLPTDEERAAAWAGASAMLTGRGEPGRATALFLAALEAGEAGLPDGSPALRALAVAGNNLAAALESHPSRDRDATAAMLLAAEAACSAWRRAGGWIEHARAELRWTSSLLAAGRPDDAARHARAAIAICDAHGAPACERFPCEAALVRACRAAGAHGEAATARARALATYGTLSDAERAACVDEFVALGAPAFD